MKTTTSERDLALAAMRLLASQPSGAASYRRLLALLPDSVDLSETDCEPSSTRPTELRWEQRVRNINSHRRVASNFICKGYLKPIPDGLAITDQGQQFLQSAA